MAIRFRGFDLVHPINRLAAGFATLATNVRAYINGGFTLRNPLTTPIGPASLGSESVSTGTVSQTGGGTAWTNPSDIFSTSATSAQVSIAPGASSQTLNISALGFAIPATATVTGVEFLFYSGSGSLQTANATLQPTANGIAAGPSVPTTLGGTIGYPVLCGGMGNLLGFAWTPTNVNGATGIGFQITCAVAGGGHFFANISLNALVVTVYYTTQIPIALPDAPYTIRRLNDSTPNGPSSGYALVIGAGGKMYVNNTEVASGLSGNPVSLVPFRPNASVQPWMYVGDSAPQGDVTITASGFVCSGMLKIRSDGLTYKMGIKEPQLAPVVSTSSGTVTTTGTLLATDIPWTNYLGQNPSFNYGESHGPPDPTPDGTPPFIIEVLNASTVTVTSLTGTATINGGLKVPTDAGPAPGPTNPGGYVQVGGVVPGSVSVVVGAFTDGAGNVLPLGLAPLYITSVVDVGGNIGVAIPVPFGAEQFQIGINSTGNTFSSNSGSFALVATVTTNALPTTTALLGNLSLSYFDDSPTSGGVAVYLWRNPDDPSGSGPSHSISNAVGTTTGNSLIFDANFGSQAVPAQPTGIPGPPSLDEYSTAPSVITVPMQWFDISPESVVLGSAPVFPAPLTKTYPTNTSFDNFNFCLTGNIYFPSAGNYTFVLTYKDDIIWGIGGGVTLFSASGESFQYASGNPPTLSSTTSRSTTLSEAGQSITVVSGLPLLPRVTALFSGHGLGGVESQATVVVSVPNAGVYPIEVDYDFWYHSGRILLINVSATAGGAPTLVPPLPASVRQETQYRYVYRSSTTGALSNPSPESAPETVPVTANTVTSYWSNDPQVDVVDYYRVDSTTANFTYVATGPNDDLGGGGTNTPITDSLTDTELGTQLLEYDNFEPFPSIDLPQKGTCSVSGGVITWVSGGAIGGSATGFNIRWLGGTVILIGSPTSLPYIFIARPTSTTTIEIPNVPDGTNLVYEIPEPILAAQPMPYIAGPTDNIPFACGVGDPLRPATYYWSKGNNLDSAPDTNQQDITDPSETLINLVMTTGKVLLGSIKRFWNIVPNFFNALATATGTSGSTWSTRLTPIDRGLFMPRCVAVSGGGNVFFRVDDGVHVSVAGLSSKSITDETLYPLFSHEGSIPTPVTRNGVIIYPPDDTHPQFQQFTYQNGYLYYDYGYNFSGTIVTNVSFVPENAASAGSGIAWLNPPGALLSGTPVSATITSWSVSGGVMTFISDNDFVAGEAVNFADMVAGSFLNGIPLVVISSGLSSTQFSAVFPYPDTGATADSGNATPAIPNYASLSIPNPPFTPDAGEYVAYSLPTAALPPNSGFTTFAGAKAGIASASWIAGGACGTANTGTPDTPFLTDVDCGWSGFTVPTLPVGAVITRIYPVAVMANFETASGFYFVLSGGVGVTEVWSEYVTADGQYSAPSPADSLGSLAADITGAYLNLNLTARTGPWPGRVDVSSVALAVYYTVSSGALPSNQSQTLELTGTGLSIPPGAVVTGIEIDFESGLVFGGASDETIQLTVSGTPVGNVKAINPGSWPLPYTLGGNGDLWGQGGMSGTQANNLGANFASGLNLGSQLNLNEVSLTVFYEASVEETGNATLVFDTAAEGWILDKYIGPIPTIHAADEGESQQGILVGCSDGTVRLMSSSGTETVTGTVLTPAFGGVGWQNMYEATVEYTSNQAVTLTFIVADEGNGSYGPPPITLPATTEEPTKYTFKVGANKYKLLQMQFQSTDPALAVYLDGCILNVHDWGSSAPYRPVNPFTPSGGTGGQA
jgi:hypothetical protein